MITNTSVPFRVTHTGLKWEFPFVFGYSKEQAIQEVMDSLSVEKKNKDIFSRRNWSAKEMLK